MKNSPLQLERYYLSEVHFETNDALPTEPLPELQLESAVEVHPHKNDGRRFRVLLKVGFQPGSADAAHQKASAVFTGYFVVDANYPQEKVLVLVETNAPSVLYGAARELFCNLTARGPWPMVTLPTQSFYNSVSKPESKK
jgi:preprotein translocase subunit SecB